MGTITLQWKYIKYDIDQETYKAGNMLITGAENAEVRNEAQTNQDDFDCNFCLRKIEQALVNLQVLMLKFFSSISRQDESGNETTSDGNMLNTITEKWVLSFDFSGRRLVDEISLANVMHRYIVLYVLQEWAKIAFPALEKGYVERMLAEEERIKAIIYNNADAPTKVRPACK